MAAMANSKAYLSSSFGCGFLAAICPFRRAGEGRAPTFGFLAAMTLGFTADYATASA